ncbi:somatostatin receptor type 1-like [Triplophysa dalaica]|uniref:somatostatin receptor type 1-like n=1 Tax=Triplophysa dalaica TaxID=1582913 RepID=UPI0024DF506F|nr:somatostatin receptor type 1-like [Triplophysa dalaica]
MNNSTVDFITPPLNKDVNTMEISMMSIQILFGFPTQSYVIWLIIKGTGNGITMEFFLLNSAVCEILVCLYCLMLILSKLWLSFILFGLFLQGLLFAGRALFQCLICVERYLAVVHPVIFLKYKPLRYRVMCCTSVWLFCLGSCFFCVFSLMSFNTNAQAWFFSILFLVLLPIQLFCLSAVLRALKQSGPGEKGSEREKENQMKRRAFYLILITTVNMVFMYAPFIFTGFFTIVTQAYVQAVWIPAMVSYGVGGYLQPVLYLHRCGKLACCAST